MRSLQRILACAAVLILCALDDRVRSFMNFGSAVLVGDREVFAGEPANYARPGTVYIYRKGASLEDAWREVGTLTAPDATVGDAFGSSLAPGEGRLFVGAGPAVVHVYEKRDTTWTFSGTISAKSVPGDTVRFGKAVASSGEYLFVGREPVNLGSRGRGAFFAPPATGQAPPPMPAGAVYVFRRNATGTYAHAATLTATGTDTAGDNFGHSVAAADGMLLVGASGHATRTGIVHEFGLGADGTWTFQRNFTALSAQTNDLFGSQLALVGDAAMVSAPGDQSRYGAVYVFRRMAQGGRGAAEGGPPAPAAPQAPAGNFTWREFFRLTAPVATRADRFGSTVTADERETWVGAPGGGPGRVYAFTVSANGVLVAPPRVVGPSWVDSVAIGGAVSLRGGIAAVGAAGYNSGAGGVLIYERDMFGVWREHPILTTPLDEIPAYTGAERRCSGAGKVEIFDCGATSLLAFLPPSRLSATGQYADMSSIWGWTDSATKQEWALLGRADGTTFVDITAPTRPIPVADLPLTEGARPSFWREIKVYKDHAYIVSDGSGPHGVQIFDLTRLRTMKPQPNGLPQKVSDDGIYRNVASVHNIVINEDTGFMYPVGSNGGGNTCGGGLHMVDIREPKSPKFVGCHSDPATGMGKTGYSHDAVCVVYKGPDKRYKGREICVGSNETAISIADVTDKANTKTISRSTYPNVAYTHQGWWDETQRYFYVNDEGDEMMGTVKKTRTLIWDLEDLENPRFAKEHLGVESATDHNLYIKGTLMYQANYRSGLRVLSISDPLNPKEVAYFDTAPYHPNTPGFNGAWSVYPFFKSGTIIVSSIEQGLFIVRTADR
ncbi:MAG TPA: choice-of-anchor B family protein [Vicinamibacterales bacterium]|nr:choice-of-anchor B family protein [Vicinamibacterales bacterium]